MDTIEKKILFYIQLIYKIFIIIRILYVIIYKISFLIISQVSFSSRK